MTDLRALLLEPWCEKCGQVTGWHELGSGYTRIECKCGGVKQPLATRLPESVPPGLECNDRLECWLLDGSSVMTDEQAEILYIGQAAKMLTGGNPSVEIHMSCDLAKLAAALHRMADDVDPTKT